MYEEIISLMLIAYHLMPIMLTLTWIIWVHVNKLEN